MQTKQFPLLFVMFRNIFPSIAARPFPLCLMQTFTWSRDTLQRDLGEKGLLPPMPGPPSFHPTLPGPGSQGRGGGSGLRSSRDALPACNYPNSFTRALLWVGLRLVGVENKQNLVLYHTTDPLLMQSKKIKIKKG